MADSERTPEEPPALGISHQNAPSTLSVASSQASIHSQPPELHQGKDGEKKGDDDPEKGTGVDSEKSGPEEPSDPNKISWDGPDDPEAPKNWSTKRKWIATFVVASFTFISPLSSSIPAPALNSIGAELGIETEIVKAMVVSIFVLAFAFGPLILGPLSEIFGRVPVLQGANLFYLVFNLVCGFAKTPAQILVFRFLSGLGGSGPLAIGGGVLGDCWRPEQRGQALSVYSLAPVLGPAIGPIAGGFIAENTTWRWVFWSTSIADVVIMACGIFWLPETYAPKLLANKAKRLRKQTGNDKLYAELSTEPMGSKLRTSLSRPFILLATQPIVMVLALYMAFIYGLIYLVLTTYPTLFTSPDYYSMPLGISGLNYIAIGLGFFLGAQLSAPINDRIYRKLKARNNGEHRPEYRCIVMMPAALIVPIGLFWYGWSAEAHVHWIMVDIGAAIFAAGMMVIFQSIQTYIIDAYTRYAASALAAITVLRSLGGFGFPLMAPYMYNAMGYGWGNSLLAFVSIAIGIPAPVLLWKRGAALRRRSGFAAGL